MAPEFSSTASYPPKLWWWVAIGLAIVAISALPHFVDIAVQLNLSIIFVFAMLAVSMGFLWGYAGILSFGQTIFFGLGGYTYAILALNTDMTVLSFLGAIIIPAIFSALLGYFMIYGRISDIYLSVITLVVTLIFEKSIRSTSGPEYVIGSIRLNGQNGIPGVPGLSLPWLGDMLQSIEGIFSLSASALLFVYVGLRLVLLTRFGRVIVGIRENERRMELLGYNTRRYRLAAFVLSGSVAALSGVLYALWGNFVAPEMFNLNQAAQVVVWVIVGGRSTLIGPVIGTGLIQYLSNWLGTVGAGQVSLVLGAVLMLFVLVFPRGLLPTIGDFLGFLMSGLGLRRQR
jgi:branched-chain amino acid transport system permease protein